MFRDSIFQPAFKPLPKRSVSSSDDPHKKIDGARIAVLRGRFHYTLGRGNARFEPALCICVVVSADIGKPAILKRTLYGFNIFDAKLKLHGQPDPHFLKHLCHIVTDSPPKISSHHL